MAPNGKKKADTPSFDDVEAKRVEMLKSLSAVAEAMEQASSSVRAYLSFAPNALSEPPAEGGKKRKAADKKKAKDPDAPKRPVTGYLAYSKDQMPKLRLANPDMPHKVLVGLVTEQWANLPEEEKKPYNDNFSAAMKEWKGKTQEYKASHENGAPAAVPAVTSTETVASEAKPVSPDAETASEADSDEDDSAPTASDSSDSSETEEEDAKDDDDEEQAAQPPAKRTKREAPAPPAATPSKSEQKPKATPVSTSKKTAAAAAETSKKDKKSKKTEAAPASSEETPAKKRGRKPKAQ